MEISMNNGKVTIKNKGSAIASGIRNGNLYELVFDIDQELPNSTLSAPTYNTYSNDDISLWHSRIGDLVTYQLSDNYIKNLSKIVDGLNTERDWFTSECLVCTQGKQSSNPFHDIRTRTKRRLQLVHIVPTSRSGKC